MKRKIVSAALLFGMLGTASAADIVDQSNTRIATAPPISTHAIGGSSRQVLAQTFIAGMTGSMTKLRLPLGCDSGTLIVEIAEQGSAGDPVGRVLRRAEVPASSVRRVIPTPADFIDIWLPTPLTIAAGDELAIVLRNDTGECGVARAEAGQTYDRGNGYFISLPETSAWALLDLGGLITADPADLPFQTVLDDGTGTSSGGCAIAGLGAIGDVPVCRCLRDDGLREFRCALLHPDFFAIRRIPWPIPLGRPYAETWEILPMTKLDGAVSVRLSGASLPKPATMSFPGKSRKMLETRFTMLKAPAEAVEVKGEAVLTYGKESWRLDTSIPAEQFGSGPGLQFDKPKP